MSQTKHSVQSVATTNGITNKTEAPGKSPKDTSNSSRTENTKDEENLSGAELKKKKQAEKAARRAQVKQAKEEPTVADLKAPRKADDTEANKKAGPKQSSAKSGHHKRAGSTQKTLPVRIVQASEVPATPQVGKEVKKVALFGHLYGQPRRTTIAAAGKDVHPAVLALGLQMSNYVLCGSSVRCVATLLAFKRVRMSWFCRCSRGHAKSPL